MAQYTDVSSALSYAKDLNEDGFYDSALVVLYNALKTDNSSDTIDLIYTYYEIGESYLNVGKCDSALHYIAQGLGLSEGNQAKLADGFQKQAKALGGCSGKWSEAIQTLQQSMLIKQERYGTSSIEVSDDYTLMGYLNNYHGRYDSALFYLTRALEIRSDNPEFDLVELSVTHYYLGKVYERTGDLKRALKHSRYALQIREELLRPDHPSTSNCLNDVGNIYKSLGNFDRALEHYLKGLEIRKQTLGPDHVNVGASYYSIGTLYGNMFNYQRAIHFIEQGNLIIEKRFGTQLPVLHTYYAYLARMYHKAGRGKKAIELFNLAEKLAEEHLSKDHPYRAIIYEMLGQYYSDLDLVEAQREYDLKALKIYQTNGKGSASEADVLLRLGNASIKHADYTQSEKYYNDALNIYLDKLGHKHPKTATLYQYFGDLRNLQGEKEEALSFYWKSLDAISYNEIRRDSMIDLQSLTHKQMALKSLDRIGAIYKLSAQNKASRLEDLTTSLMFYNLAIDLIDFIAAEYKLEDSRAQLSKDTRNVFNNAMEVAFDLHQLSDQANHKYAFFRIMEKSKSPILAVRVQEKEARRFANIPDSLIEKESDLRVEISYFKEQLRNARAKGDLEKVNFFQTEVFDSQNSYESFKKDLKDQYPKYYNYWYSGEVVDLSDLKNSLSSKSLMIAYHEADDAIYISSINQDQLKAFKVPASASFHNAVRNYKKSLTDNVFIVESPRESDSLLVSSAHFLYENLLKPVLASAPEVSKLIIVPDGYLSGLSFGTLLTEAASPRAVKYDKLKYLVSSHELSYEYSATLYYKHKYQTKSSRTRFAGFAPSYELKSYANVDSTKHPMAYELVRSGQLSLPGAIEEVKKINALFGGRIWISEEATERNFKQNAGAYTMLHLAMHSLINMEDPEYSELLFNAKMDTLDDGYLTVDEIYNLNIDASMVVLSACSSGSGSVQVGEGPISFTRAFSYAGCPSVIMSMWKLPDAATNQIMVAFYENIKAGDPKDQALRKAQLQYLSDTDDPLYQHPFFWGSFVAMGNTEPIEEQDSNAGILLLIVAVLILVAMRFRKRLSLDS